MANKRKYHHGNLKQALVDAGLEILEEAGLAGLSLRACAERTGVSHTAPKNHFGNMSGLLTAIAARGYQQLAQTMQKGLDADATRSRKSDAALQGYVEFAVTHPALFELMFSRHRTNSDDPNLLELASQCFAILRDVSEGLVWEWSDAPDAALRAQMMHWSLVHGFAQLSASGKLNKDSMKHLGILDIFPQFEYRA